MRILPIIIFAAIILSTGCQPVEDIPIDVPEGWESDGRRWWHVDADTAGMFRDLETLMSMGIKGAGPTDPAMNRNATNMEAARGRLIFYVKDSLIPLFRNRPQVVDSLFEKYVVPKMESARLEGDVRPIIMTFKREGYRIINRHFHEPYTVTKLGVDIPVPIPDSLQSKQISGMVFMQVYISADGEPLAIEKLEGVHPILDRIALRATTRMRWQPAYLLRGGKSRPLASWARFKVNFSTGR